MNKTVKLALIKNTAGPIGTLIAFKNLVIVKGTTAYTIITTTSNVTADASNPTTITVGGTATLEFKADNGYRCPQTAPTVTGATIASWTVTTSSETDDTGTLVITNPTANVQISVIGAKVYSITTTATNITAAASNPTSIVEGGTATLTFTADGTAYKMPTHAAVDGSVYIYNRISDTQATIELMRPTANVVVTISGESAWESPTQVGSNLTITQAYTTTQSGDAITIQ